MFDCDSKNLLLTVLCMPTSVVLVLVFMLVSVRDALPYCCVIPYGNSVNLLQNCDHFEIVYPCFFRSHFLVFISPVVFHSRVSDSFTPQC